jgi:hypothetical protein
MSGVVPPMNREQRIRSTAAVVVGCLLQRCRSDDWGRARRGGFDVVRDCGRATPGSEEGREIRMWACSGLSSVFFLRL